MNQSSDAAEQIVRMSLQGFEVGARITGSGAKEVAALLLAVIKDKKKSGGKYITITSNIKSVDLINRFIKLVSNQKILIDDIYDLKSELFININN